jgi:hypothetical protein
MTDVGAGAGLDAIAGKDTGRNSEVATDPAGPRRDRRRIDTGK